MMKIQETGKPTQDLSILCSVVRDLVNAGEYPKCERLICEAIGHYPNAAAPHNLIGILLEKEGEHLLAMKHFRAAWALDPTYRPAQHNLDSFGTFFSRGKYAYDESDCPEEKHNDYLIEYDARSNGHVVSRR